MRIDTQEFAEYNKAATKEPVFVVALSFDSANTDIHYLTSALVPGLTGNIINNTLKIVSSTSQTINPEKAIASIGSISFECLDIGLTSLQQTKLSEQKGLNQKRVRVYQGYKGLLWENFQLIQTQVIDGEISYKDGVYKFRCSDAQRFLRKKIFIPKETVLTSSITADQTVIPAFDTTRFKSVYQVPSAQGKTYLRALQQKRDGQNNLVYPELAGVDEVGFFELENDDDYETVMWYSKDDQTNTFTGCIRGALGTKALAVTVDPDATNQNAPKITEHVYLEMPGVKLAYAIMTGLFYGHAGKYLPDHWHLGVSTDYVQTSAFVNIGSDLWDINDDDAGYPARVNGYEKIDGKKFLESDLFYMMGVYSPIRSTGELSLKRIKYIGPNGGYDRLLNEDNVVSYGPLVQKLNDIRNTFILKWHWDEKREKYSRTSVFRDEGSIEPNTETDPKIIELKTLHGSRHSDTLIDHHFSVMRTMHSSTPYEISLELTPDQNDLEVGDIVRLDLDAVRDAAAETTISIDRNFEIRSIKNDWFKGRVHVSLVGSSRKPAPQAPDNTETPDDVFLTSEGTEINATNFPGQVSSSNGVTTVTGTINLTGHASMGNPNAVYYCSEDLTIDASGTVIVNNNTQIRVNGFFQQFGTIDGKGRGLPGGVADNNPTHSKNPVSSNLGQAGVGNTLAQGGMIRRPYQDGRDFYESTDEHYGPKHDSFTPRIVRGNTQTLETPVLVLDDNGNLNGVPNSLMGSSGSSGGPILQFNETSVIVPGGDGGNGGAGLMIFAKGMDFSLGSTTDLSGGDGLPGGVITVEGEDLVAAGAGAGGAPGGLLLVTLDSSQTFPTPNSEIITQNYGVCPETTLVKYVALWDGGPDYHYKPEQVVNNPPFSSRSGGGGMGKTYQNAVDVFSDVVFLDTRNTPEDDFPRYVDIMPTFTLTEYRNTPVTPQGDRSTIEISITPPDVDYYSHSIVRYRKQGSEIWLGIGSVSAEGLLEVPSDGSTYEIWVDPVSTAGLTAGLGPKDFITVTDVNGRTNAELVTIYPFDPIVDLGLDGAGTSFSGPGPVFQWDHTNGEKIYFNYYAVEIRSGGTLLRVEKSVSPFYEYSIDKNATDYAATEGVDGYYFDIEIRVKPVSKYYNNQGQLYAGSEVTFTATASVTNAPDNLRFLPTRGEQQQQIDDADNNNATPYALISNATMKVNGSIVEKISDNIAWTGEVYTAESFVDGAFCSFKAETVTRYLMLGLSSDPTVTNGYNDIDYAVYLRGDGSWQIRKDGVNLGTIGAYSVGDVFTITYDGLYVRFYQNGVQAGSNLPEDAGRKYHFNTSFRDVGAKISSLQFGPYTNNDWSNVGGDGRPDDNATDGATWEDNITGQPPRLQLYNNLLDRSGWIAGDTSTNPSDSTNGLANTASNSRVVTDGPYGEDEIVWRVEHVGDGSANFSDQGGFQLDPANSNPCIVSENQTCRITCWLRSDNIGDFLVQSSSSSVLLTLDGGVNPGYPYVYAMNDDTLPEANKWFLLVMVIHAATTSRTVSSGIAGLYDPVTGQKVQSFVEYKFDPTANGAGTTLPLSAQFRYRNSGTAGAWAEFARPRVDSIDGTEPPLGLLMSSAGDGVVSKQPPPTGFIRAGNTYLVSDASLFAFDLEPMGENAWYLVGPGGASDVDDYWSALNDLPENTKALIVNFDISVSPSADGARVMIYENDSTVGSNSTNERHRIVHYQMEQSSNSGKYVTNQQVIIPATNKQFYLYYSVVSVFSGVSRIINMHLVGFITD